MIGQCYDGNLNVISFGGEKKKLIYTLISKYENFQVNSSMNKSIYIFMASTTKFFMIYKIHSTIFQIQSVIQIAKNYNY